MQFSVAYGRPIRFSVAAHRPPTASVAAFLPGECSAALRINFRLSDPDRNLLLEASP